MSRIAWVRGELACVVGASQRAERPGYAELGALVAEQAAVIARLEARVAEQDALIADLRARLGQNSRNSSKPPSSDGYGKPAPRSLRRRSGRKPGGQPGSPGHRLERSEDPVVTLVHPAERCDGCGGDLRDASIEGSESRQVFDLPELPRLGCVEHWIQRWRCRCCGHLTSSSFPEGVRAPVQYGPKIRALGIYQHLPYERAAELLSDWERVAPALTEDAREAVLATREVRSSVCEAGVGWWYLVGDSVSEVDLQCS